MNGPAATKQPMLSSTHAVFRWLQTHLKDAIKKLPANTDPALRRGLIDAHVKLGDYFTKFDKSRYYSWATLLDPRLSYEGLCQDYANEPDLLQDLEQAKAGLELHYDLYYSDSDESFTRSTTPMESGPESPMKFDIFSRYGTQTASDGTKNELAEYFRLTSSPEPFEGTDPLM
ncbi:hypothetical protein B0H10DRAFT_20993 [Mycena sp. CBHHK59/15]|nr:hypothetical protein B0H10DRAFT_20993 [Mycena sp. CBHHK59/15]